MKKLMSTLVGFLVLGFVVGDEAFGAAPAAKDLEQLRVYEVNKRVCDFPEKEDFSTPEAAYAVINRVMASGEEGTWRRISTKRNKGRVPPPDAERKEVKPEIAKQWLNARIVEVRIFQGRHAVAIAEVPREGKAPFFDKRTLDLEDGRWLNAGQSLFGTIEKARAHFARSCAKYVDKPVRPRIDDPGSYLKPFVEFLKTNAEEPKAFVMKALAKYKVVIMGEIHHRPRHWAFNSSLVADPNFTKHIGTIYMELPSNDQGLVDKFLAAEGCNTVPVIEMLRDMLWMGWPDQPMLDFFMTVWMVNQDLEPQQRLRIILVDMQRPWNKIRERGDWRQYEIVLRDQQMAHNILADSRRQQDERNALFIVGVGHAMLNLKYFEGSPMMSAAWYLRKELGPENVYAFFPHKPVGTNWGRYDGRLCLGLFDSAFAVIGNRPVAFPLTKGPFGEQAFDAFADNPAFGNYSDGYSAYLYLGPLETEIFSPLIAGFYTDEFVKELDRRHRLMFNRGLVEGCHLAGLDSKSFISWMSGKGGSWGKPWKWRNKLGPIEAWKHGDDWEKEIQEKKQKDALENPEVIKTAARKLFDAIRDADYEYHYGGKHHNVFLPEDMDYQVHHHFDSWVKWMCKTFKDNPIQSVELGEVFKGRKGLPAVSYKVTLQDGKKLEGTLPFEYQARQGYWMGIEGIDWHLQDASSSRQ